MADKERISQPSSGSNELGSETKESRITGGLSAGTDTQLHLAVLGSKKHENHKKGTGDNLPKDVANKKKR